MSGYYSLSAYPVKNSSFSFLESIDIARYDQALTIFIFSVSLPAVNSIK